MKTKVVYVLTSSMADTYLEQMWISIHSLRRVQPDAYIQVVTDRQTADSLIGTRRGWIELVNEETIIECPKEYNSLYRSRYIRTKLRHFVSGDYLVVDNDTVFGAPIGEIDQTEGSICGVLDYVQSNLRRGTPSYKRAELLGWDIYIGEKPYVNCGVLFVKEDHDAIRFYEKWHSYWLESVEKGLHYDQLAFNMAKISTEELVKLLPEKWNYQIKPMPLGTRYKDATIFHYFTTVSPTQWPMTILEMPLLYSHMKESGELPQYIIDLLRNPAAMFQQRIICTNLQQQQQHNMPLFQFLKFHTKIRTLLNGIATFVMKHGK